jgi:archaellum biogenesis ATPase FlaH
MLENVREGEEMIPQQSEEVKKAKVKAATKPSNVMTGAELLAMKETEIPMLLKGMLKKVGIATLAGSSDVGKSFLCLDLALAICSNETKVFGVDINRTHGRVLLVSTEDEISDVAVRLNNLVNGRKINLDRLTVIFAPTNPLKQIQDELKKNPVDLIILDTFGDLFTGNINQSVEVRTFFKPYKELATEHQCAIIFNHHIGKSKEMNGAPSKNDLLGSQGIESASRTVLMLGKKPDGKRVLTVVKGNCISEELKNTGIEMEFSPNTGFTPTGKMITKNDDDPKTGFTPEQVALMKKIYEEKGNVKDAAKALKELGLAVDKNKIKGITEGCPSVQAPSDLDDGQLKVAA